MAKWFYYNESGEKIEVTGGELKKLAKAGAVTPDTIVETEEGKAGPARRVKGLTFASSQADAPTYKTLQSVPEVPAPVESNPSIPVNPSPPIQSQSPDSAQLFCTNCGQPISEQAIVCLSCGADPRSHRKFCRCCGVVLNPEQIICIKCGAEIGTAHSCPIANGTAVNSTVLPQHRVETASTSSTLHGSSNDGLMWMHFTLPFIPLATLIIWFVIKDKEPRANTHGKNALNAFLSLSIYYVGLGFIVGIASALSAAGIASESIVLPFLAAIVSFCAFGFWLFVVVLVIVSAIRIGRAAANGEVLPYKWAWNFFKTENSPITNSQPQAIRLPTAAPHHKTPLHKEINQVALTDRPSCDENTWTATASLVFGVLAIIGALSRVFLDGPFLVYHYSTEGSYYVLCGVHLSWTLVYHFSQIAFLLQMLATVPGVFFGCKGMTTSKAKTAKVGLLFCGIAWLIIVLFHLFVYFYDPFWRGV